MSDFLDPSSQPTPATPNVDLTPAPATPGAPSPSPTPATPAVGTQPGATQPGGNEALVPSYRLREIRDQYEQRLQAERAKWESDYKRELEIREKKIQALAGVLPQEVTQQDQITEQFYKLFPQFKGLTPEKMEQIEKALERSAALEAENEMRWQNHGHQQLNRLFSLAYEAGLPDTDATRSRLHTALIGYLQVNPQEQQRFAVDPNFVPEFFKAYAAEMIDPLRRSQAAAVQGRVVPPIPQDSPSGAVRTMTQPPKPQNVDERASLSWTAFQQSKNAGR